MLFQSYTGAIFLRCRSTSLMPRVLFAVAALAALLAFGPASAGVAQAAPGQPPVSQNLTQPVFRLIVPFRTQKDGSRWQGSNCGPATLGMLLDGFGMTGQDTDDLRFRAHTYQGTVGMRTGTAL